MGKTFSRRWVVFIGTRIATGLAQVAVALWLLIGTSGQLLSQLGRFLSWDPAFALVSFVQFQMADKLTSPTRTYGLLLIYGITTSVVSIASIRGFRWVKAAAVVILGIPSLVGLFVIGIARGGRIDVAVPLLLFGAVNLSALAAIVRIHPTTWSPTPRAETTVRS